MCTERENRDRKNERARAPGSAIVREEGERGGGGERGGRERVLDAGEREREYWRERERERIGCSLSLSHTHTHTHPSLSSRLSLLLSLASLTLTHSHTHTHTQILTSGNMGGLIPFVSCCLV